MSFAESTTGCSPAARNASTLFGSPSQAQTLALFSSAGVRYAAVAEQMDGADTAPLQRDEAALLERRLDPRADLVEGALHLRLVVEQERDAHRPGARG